MRLVTLGLLAAVVGLSSVGAKCVTYTWPDEADRATYGDIHWNDTVLGSGEYRFTPAYPVRERELGTCFDHRDALVTRGAFNCRSMVLDVDTPTGTVEVSDVSSLLAIFGPIDNEEEAASFAQATIGGYARYDGATATAPNGNFLVRMRDLRDNCSPTAGFYAIAYEVTPTGSTRIVAEQVRSTPGPALCVD